MQIKVKYLNKKALWLLQGIDIPELSSFEGTTDEFLQIIGSSWIDMITKVADLNEIPYFFEDMIDKSLTGKFLFLLGRIKIDKETALENIKYSYEDGLVSLFYNGKQYKTKELLSVVDGGEVMFVKNVFLSSL